MKRFIYAFFLLNIFVQPTIAMVNGNGSSHFIGLWKGIDTYDGSVTLLSVTDVNNDGVMNVRLTDSFLLKCKEAGYGTSPGLVMGDATIQNKILHWDYSFNCFNNETNKLVEISKGHRTFEYNAVNDILIDDAGEMYHHISNH